MFAAKMSLARLKTGPLNQVAIGAIPTVRGSGSAGILGVLTGTLASMISSSGTGGNRSVRSNLSRANRGANRDGAHKQRRREGDQRAGEVRLSRHSEISLLPIRICLRAGASYYSRVVPIPENRQKHRGRAIRDEELAGFAA
jgi:hypothetical protein